MVQEHERSIGGWHAEWPTVVEIVKATGAALASMATTIEGLTVSADTMRRNIEQTRGTIFAERAVMMLAGVLERDSAQRLVQQAVERSRTSGRRLAEELADTPEVTNVLTPEVLASLENPAEYLGSAEALRRRLLGS
jgi:3-carboxy-cis,cis-muconate cycloisomerase